MKLKRGLSLIIAGMMLLTSLNICVFADTESDTDTGLTEYTAPQSIYYIDFENVEVGTTGVDAHAGITASKLSNCTVTVAQDGDDTNKYLNVATDGTIGAQALLQFLKKTTTSDDSAGGYEAADKYVIDYRIRPHIGAGNSYIRNRTGGYGIMIPGFFNGNISEQEHHVGDLGDYTDGEWYTITVVIDSDYVDKDGNPYTDGTQYYARDYYINGIKVNENPLIIDASSNTKFFTAADSMFTHLQTYALKAVQSSYDLDYMRFYASKNTFAAKLAKTEGVNIDSIEVQFNNIPDVDSLIANAVVLDENGIEVARVCDATVNNYFNPGVDYAQSITLELDTDLAPGKPHTLKFNELADVSANTLTTELAFSTKALEVYAHELKLMSGGLEQTTLADGTYNVDFSFTNETNEAVYPVIAAALYDSEGVLSSLKLEEVEIPAKCDGESFTITDVVLSGTEGGKLKLFALKSAEDWAPASAVQVIDESSSTSEGEFNAAFSAYETAFETKYSVDGDTFAITTGVKEWDSAMSGRQAVVVTFKEGKGISDVSLDAPLETVIGLESAALTEDGVTYKIPDVMGNYPTKFYISNSALSADGLVEYFGSEYINTGLEIIKDIEASEVDGFLTNYEKALSIDLSAYNALSDPDGKDFYAKSIEALRNEKDTEKFAGYGEFFAAMAEAQIFANIKDGASVKPVIDEKLKDEKEYELWTETLSDDAYSAVLSEVKTAGVLTYSQLANAFEKAVVLEGIEHADNYSQTLSILGEMYSEIGIEDLSSYNGTVRKEVAEELSVNKYDDYTALKGAFELALKEALLGDDGDGSGGGGGGSSRPSNTSGFGGIGNVAMAAPQVSAGTNNDTDNKNVSFTDLSGFEWASDAIYALAKKGIINGKAENSYAPADLITRAELTKLVVAFYGLKSGETESNFDDVDKSDWYYAYINAGVANGIINGTGEGLFSPDTNVTREMAAAIIYRAAQKSGKVFEKSKNEFGDKAEIEEYALDAVGYLSGAGILNGDETGNVKPKAALTRAEAAVLLNNLLK